MEKEEILRAKHERRASVLFLEAVFDSHSATLSLQAFTDFSRPSGTCSCHQRPGGVPYMQQSETARAWKLPARSQHSSARAMVSRTDNSSETSSKSLHFGHCGNNYQPLLRRIHNVPVICYLCFLKNQANSLMKRRTVKGMVAVRKGTKEKSLGIHFFVDLAAPVIGLVVGGAWGRRRRHGFCQQPAWGRRRQQGMGVGGTDMAWGRRRWMGSRVMRCVLVLFQMKDNLRTREPTQRTEQMGAKLRRGLAARPRESNILGALSERNDAADCRQLVVRCPSTGRLQTCGVYISVVLGVHINF
jgi:hypothetical protein